MRKFDSVKAVTEGVWRSYCGDATAGLFANSAPTRGEALYAVCFWEGAYQGFTYFFRDDLSARIFAEPFVGTRFCRSKDAKFAKYINTGSHVKDHAYRRPLQSKGSRVIRVCFCKNTHREWINE